MEQSALLGQPGTVGEVFLVTSERLREVFYFFRLHWLALLLLTLPFALASTLVVLALGQPLPATADQQVTSAQWQSALLLLLMHPLALGVKTVAIHHLASGDALRVGGVVLAAMRLWPTLAALALLSGLFVGAATLLSLGVGIELLQGMGLLKGVGGGLLFLFLLPGIYLYARVGSAPVIAVAEGLSAITAMSAAWQRSLSQHLVMFRTVLVLALVLLSVLLLLFAALAAPASDAAAAADSAIAASTDSAALTTTPAATAATTDAPSVASSLFIQAIGEWLFCLLTIAFYRFWSLLPRSP